jgi:hypothetical protein
MSGQPTQKPQAGSEDEATLLLDSGNSFSVPVAADEATVLLEPSSPSIPSPRSGDLFADAFAKEEATMLLDGAAAAHLSAVDREAAPRILLLCLLQQRRRVPPRPPPQRRRRLPSRRAHASAAMRMSRAITRIPTRWGGCPAHTPSRVQPRLPAASLVPWPASSSIAVRWPSATPSRSPCVRATRG